MNEEIKLIDRIAVSAAEAAQLMGVSRTTIYQYFQMDGFPVRKIAGRVLIPVDELKAWLIAQSEITE